MWDEVEGRAHCRGPVLKGRKRLGPPRTAPWHAFVLLACNVTFASGDFASAEAHDCCCCCCGGASGRLAASSALGSAHRS